ncbi:glycerophosphodiester phosphodiesterase GDPD6-like isoform X2 [Olea europaea var. sylvestris]|uniref:glycerophosphodiester phosphodiesterase GDPD6-like isoform X2 n=1 Tax=Olea europaea var. sylvestris TaxID=158386 RepID=UPI000C1D341B|nr:glycerophosphodiester phosphodiesterase GDPD6-like isoform X2 [Olea europaea var. sylvestris]
MASPSRCVFPFIFMLFLVGCSSRSLYPLPNRRHNGNRQPLQTFRPYNIAHRGSNGEIPEETTAAYKRAIEEGTDFIETDILASKDGVLISFHDVYLDDTTDIAEHEEFINRKRTYEVQGSNFTGYFVVDFTLKELKSLRVKQRYPFRDQQYNGKFSIITFEEFISIALDADRIVGIYPEMKNPVFINQRVKWPDGKKFEDKFVEILKKYRYRGSYMSKEWLKQPAFIQSFAPTSLLYISNQTDLPKILLIDDVNMPTQDTNQGASFVILMLRKHYDYLCLSHIGKSLQTNILILSKNISWGLDRGRIHWLPHLTIICENLLILLPEHMPVIFRCIRTLSATRTSSYTSTSVKIHTKNSITG